MLDAVAQTLKVRRPKCWATNVTVTEMRSQLDQIARANPLVEGVVMLYHFPSPSSGARYMMKLKPPSYRVLHKHLAAGRGPKLTEPEVALLLHFVGYLETEIKAQHVTDEETKQIQKILAAHDALLVELSNWCARSFEIKEQRTFADEIKQFPLRNILFTARRQTNLSDAPAMVEAVKKHAQYETTVIQTIIKRLQAS